MKDSHINYVEFKARDLDAIKEFYAKAFSWEFKDYGPTYTAFSNSGLEGGFEKTDDTVSNGVLVVLYHQDLDKIKSSIVNSGGKVSKDIFPFLGTKISFPRSIWERISGMVR